MTKTTDDKPKTIQRKRIIYLKPFKGEIQDGDLQLITDDLSTELVEHGKVQDNWKIVFC